MIILISSSAENDDWCQFFLLPDISNCLLSNGSGLYSRAKVIIKHSNLILFEFWGLASALSEIIEIEFWSLQDIVRSSTQYPLSAFEE